MKRNRIAKVTVGLAAASIALAACAGEPGAAAVVGSDRISETAFGQQVQDVLVAKGLPRDTNDPMVTTQTMSMLVTESLVNQLAEQAGVVITPGQIEMQIQAYEAQLGGRQQVEQTYLQQYGVAPSQLNDAVRFTLEVEALGRQLDPSGTADTQRASVGEAISVLSQMLDVQVSPRYGTWDNKTIHLGPVPDDLSVPANA